MEAIRKVQIVKDGQVCFNLPERFWGQEVEIIVLAVPQSQHQGAEEKKSLRGSLRQYANPALIDLEAAAWQEALREKHGTD
jgi:hypothetical protein